MAGMGTPGPVMSSGRGRPQRIEMDTRAPVAFVHWFCVRIWSLMRDVVINLGARPELPDRRNQAAKLLGKNRSHFMLEAACDKALADQASLCSGANDHTTNHLFAATNEILDEAGIVGRLRAPIRRIDSFQMPSNRCRNSLGVGH